jgi:hypothetical protein
LRVFNVVVEYRYSNTSWKAKSLIITGWLHLYKWPKSS